MTASTSVFTIHKLGLRNLESLYDETPSFLQELQTHRITLEADIQSDTYSLCLPSSSPPSTSASSYLVSSPEGILSWLPVSDSPIHFDPETEAFVLNPVSILQGVQNSGSIYFNSLPPSSSSSSSFLSFFSSILQMGFGTQTVLTLTPDYTQIHNALRIQNYVLEVVEDVLVIKKINPTTGLAEAGKGEVVIL